jgi:hypothetical protein
LEKGFCRDPLVLARAVNSNSLADAEELRLVRGLRVQGTKICFAGSISGLASDANEELVRLRHPVQKLSNIISIRGGDSW